MKLWQKIFFIVGSFLFFLGLFLLLKPLLCEVKSSGVDKQSLYCLHKRARYLKGISPLTQNPLLEKAAELRAYDIAIHGTFSHESISGQTATATAKQLGYNYHLIGENLALGDFTNKEVFEEWMRSASHSANILNPEYEDVGIYILAVEGSNDKVVVSLFGHEKKSSLNYD